MTGAPHREPRAESDGTGIGRDAGESYAARTKPKTADPDSAGGSGAKRSDESHGLAGKLRVTPITLREANAYVAANHRHHGETRGCIVVCACSDDSDVIRGVGIVGRPVARLLQDGYTAEVTRLCTDGTPNACSMLYRALWRAVRALGYRRLVTYTLPEEGGGSLRAAGFRLVGEAGGGTWDRPNTGRPRIDLHPTQEKLRWEVAA